MLNYDKFFNGIEDIYAAFGKKTPEDKVIQAIYKRIQTLPDAFMDFAVKHFEDEEKLPQNMGRYMFRDLWPEYLDRHPELWAVDNFACCPKCIPGAPGYRKVWEPEIILGQEDFTTRIIRCTCGNARNPKKEPILTDEQLHDMGWLTECPFTNKYPTMPSLLFEVVGREEKMRPAHKEYLAEIEGMEPEEIEQKYAKIPF